MDLRAAALAACLAVGSALVVPLSASRPADSLQGVRLPRAGGGGHVDLGEALASSAGKTLLVLGTYPADFNMVEYMQRVRVFLPDLRAKGVTRCMMVVNGCAADPRRPPPTSPPQPSSTAAARPSQASCCVREAGVAPRPPRRRRAVRRPGRRGGQALWREPRLSARRLLPECVRQTVRDGHRRRPGRVGDAAGRARRLLWQPGRQAQVDRGEPQAGDYPRLPEITRDS